MEQAKGRTRPLSSRAFVLASQRAWAEARGLPVDSRGYLSDVNANLRASLSKRTECEFMNGSGSELVDTPTRPAKMRALHSSSALAVNVFDYWRDRDMGPPGVAFAFSDRITSLAFEAQFPTGLPGNLTLPPQSRQL
jgi:hypothetical protein